MSGNAIYRFADTAVLSVSAADAPIVVTSDELDEQLLGTYERLGLRPGMLEALAGIVERRWWPADVTFADAAAMAGAKALAEAGVDPSAVGLLIDTSVCRDHLEPSAAVDVHEQLGLGTACLNFDRRTPAGVCQRHAVGLDDDRRRQVDYALIVDGEGGRRTQESTVARLLRPETTKDDVLENFASMTSGRGEQRWFSGVRPPIPRGIGSSAASARGNRAQQLCVGDLGHAHRRSRYQAGVELAVDTWRDAAEVFDWTDLDAYVIHQVSKVHTAAITSSLGIDPARTPVIFPTRGNIGPASIPFTLAQHASSFELGNRIACMGIGSGLNAAVIEIAW
jgi:3-oxoacyl-[acyl-carrier-protein] synthase-3